MDAGDLVHQAEQKLKGGLFRCFAGERRFGEAAELYERAANQLKLSKHWEEAADCMLQAAYCVSKTGNGSAESGYYIEAGNMMKKYSTKDAVEQFELALNLYSASGHFTQAGKLLMSIAELYEAEGIDHAETMGYYRRATEMFELDEHGQANFTKCNLKIAEFDAKSGRLEDLQEAIKIFESEGEKATRDNLSQFGAKEHFLRAGILHLVLGDAVSVNVAVERYGFLDPRFGSSREGMFLVNLAGAFESKDVDLFIEITSEYDSVARLDSWNTDQLLKVKNALQPSGDMSLEAVDLT